jgi:hypothetical protein
MTRPTTPEQVTTRGHSRAPIRQRTALQETRTRALRMIVHQSDQRVMIQVMVQPGWCVAAHQQPARGESNNAPTYMPAAASVRSSHIFLVQLACRPSPLQGLQAGRAEACRAFRQQHARHAQCITAAIQGPARIRPTGKAASAALSSASHPAAQASPNAKNDAAVRKPMRLMQGAQQASPACATLHKRNVSWRHPQHAPLLRVFH